MSETQLSITNLCFTRIGEAPITDPGDLSERATAVAAIYATIRDRVLSDYPWEFATVREQLSPNSTAPLFGWRYSYAKPEGCLKVWGVCGCRGEVDPALKYVMEGANILSNVQFSGKLPIKYTVQITSEALFSNAFVSALALRLGAEVSYRLTRDAKIKAEILKEYLMELSACRTVDARQGTPNVILPQAWQRSRRTGHSGAGWILPMGASDLTPGGGYFLAPVLLKTATPPDAPNVGDRYLVAPDATGAWSGHDGQIAEWLETYQIGAWQYNAPMHGATVIVLNNGNPEVEVFP